MTKTGPGLPGGDRKRLSMKKIGEDNPKSDAKAVGKPKPSAAAAPLKKAGAEPAANGAKKTPAKAAVTSAQLEESLKAQAAEKWVSALTSAKPPVRPRYPTGGRDGAAPPKPAPATEAPAEPGQRKSAAPSSGLAPEIRPAPQNRAKERSAPETAGMEPAAKKTRLETKASIDREGTEAAPAPVLKEQEAPPATATVAAQTSFAPPAVRPASNEAVPAPKVETPPPPAAALGAIAQYHMPDV